MSKQAELTAGVDDVSGDVLRGDLWGNGDFWDDMLDLCQEKWRRRGGGVEEDICHDMEAPSLSQYELGTRQRKEELNIPAGRRIL